MSDPKDPVASPPAPKATTAGGLLRQARQAQGLHIAALAAAIKVVPRKLELLESDQYDKLPDATFTRALAQAVCRTLKVDAKPVLALLPPLNGHRLEQVSEGLKTPFNERPGHFVPRDWASVSSPALWLAVLLVIGAVLLYALPAGWLPLPAKAPSDTAASAAGSAPFAAAASGAEGSLIGAATTESSPATAPPSAAPGQVGDSAVPALLPATLPATLPRVPGGVGGAAVAGAASAAPVAASLLQIRTTAQSWVGVTDARGTALLGRTVLPGEALGLDGPLPFKVRVGNASATALIFKGQPVDLAAFTIGNVARMELK